MRPIDLDPVIKCLVALLVSKARISGMQARRSHKHLEKDDVRQDVLVSNPVVGPLQT
jgi:hypothetical protein